MTFKELLKEKNDRLESVPLAMQSAMDKQQSKILKLINSQLSELTTTNGQIDVTAANIRQITIISDELKQVFLTKEYVNAVKEFAREFSAQTVLADQLIAAQFGNAAKTAAVEGSALAASAYIEIAKRSAIDALVGAPIDKEFIKPIQGILENAVVNGATFGETLEAVNQFVDGNANSVSRLKKYAKQITNDSFSVADRSYTSVISEALDNDWFYYSGTELDSTRCFCQERVGNYYHYKEIESWGDGKNLGDCNVGGGEWAGMIVGTNSKTIYSYLGGYNCKHSLIPVSEFIIPESDILRAKAKGFI